MLGSDWSITASGTFSLKNNKSCALSLLHPNMQTIVRYISYCKNGELNANFKLHLQQNARNSNLVNVILAISSSFAIREIKELTLDDIYP